MKHFLLFFTLLISTFIVTGCISNNKLTNPCNTDDSSGCDRTCQINTDCKCTCDCGCINTNEICEPGNTISECLVGPPKAKCENKVCKPSY